jgi:hypothetical protein
MNTGWPRRLWQGADLGLVWLVIILEGLQPVPAVNESHYLAKARHFWNPAWCPGDLFLDSGDVHWFFYATFGWLTCWFSLGAVAWIGRIVTWLLLGWSWYRLSQAVTTRWGMAPLSAGLFVLCNARLNMAGEWVVGGVESKGFAYALVWLALERMLRGRWRACWVLLGFASAFHVLIGGWTCLTVGCAWLWRAEGPPRLREILAAVGIVLVLALPGLWPALTMNAGATAEVVDQAQQIYVYQRLPHHLVFQTFEPTLIARHLVPWGLWGMLCWLSRRDSTLRPLKIAVWASGVIALLGVVISLVSMRWPSWGAALLRFYTFRTSDAMLPLGVALVGVRYLSVFTPGAFTDRALTSRAITGRTAWLQNRWRTLAVAVATLGVAAHLAFHLWQISPLAEQRDFLRLREAQWRDVCGWISQSEIPRDALFFTPRTRRTFKWYASRPEVVNWKDIPQDATSVVEWWQRLDTIHARDVGKPHVLYGAQPRWRGSMIRRGEAELLLLADRYDARYLVTGAEPRLALPRLYRNNLYAVYLLEAP